MTTIKLCPLNALQKDSLIKFSIKGQQLLAALDEEGIPYVFENKCSHENKPLHTGEWNATTAEITCIEHGAIFSLKNNGKPLCAPAFSPLEVYATEVKEENGELFVFILDL